MTKPMNPGEFAQLPDEILLKSTEFCSRRDHRGAFPYGRSYWWKMVKDGEAPAGRKLPGKIGPVHARYWTAGEVRHVISQITEGEL